MTPGRTEPVIEWAWAGSALDGATSGDAHVVAPFHEGCLVALVDGLGHGAEAAMAAREAARLAAARPGDHLLDLLRQCHQGLRHTRGAVMSFASFRASESALSWLGVGNVEGALFRRGSRTRETLTPRAGVIGYQLQAPRMVVLPVRPGDTLVMVTDGIRSHFADGLTTAEDPRETADWILARHAKGTDDAHVVVARYRGRP